VIEHSLVQGFLERLYNDGLAERAAPGLFAFRRDIGSMLNSLIIACDRPHGGFTEGVPATMPRRQNPQIPLFEAMIATFDVTSDPVFRDWGRRIIRKPV
jgi:mannose/cellobiose epimerase-like protein (N-acyl-D-glucosamine 2-epimerase family)